MRSQAIIDLKAIKKNYYIFNSLLPSDCKVMAVVKANAYGHGDTQVANALQNIGVDDFAVSNIEEAKRLRQFGIRGQIIVLGYTSIDKADDLLKYDITQTLISEEYAYALAALKKPIKCQFAIDTGMRRIGLNADNPANCEGIIRKYYSSDLLLNGLFTHLCVADTNSDDANAFTKCQIDKFNHISSLVSDLNLPNIHYMNSAGSLWHQMGNSCFARLGIILYGLKPDICNILPVGISPVLSWKSVVSMVKSVHPGDSIGYGRTYIVNTPMKIATVSTGYADGYNRLLSNKGYVLINGSRAPIIGRICMDQFMVDVSGIDNVEHGTEVVLIGKSGTELITADDLANIIGTIGYEVVCSISERVERVYIN